ALSARHMPDSAFERSREPRSAFPAEPGAWIACGAATSAEALAIAPGPTGRRVAGRGAAHAGGDLHTMRLPSSAGCLESLRPPLDLLRRDVTARKCLLERAKRRLDLVLKCNGGIGRDRLGVGDRIRRRRRIG